MPPRKKDAKLTGEAEPSTLQSPFLYTAKATPSQPGNSDALLFIEVASDDDEADNPANPDSHRDPDAPPVKDLAEILSKETRKVSNTRRMQTRMKGIMYLDYGAY
ncbi:hypothetical protein BU17DRAFT_103270 [Hysterangium stoloniferum]|nr:hypothetical protein BU17DRAFT_103270 [Hysterangium stoloniferum]